MGVARRGHAHTMTAIWVLVGRTALIVPLIVGAIYLFSSARAALAASRMTVVADAAGRYAGRWLPGSADALPILGGVRRSIGALNSAPSGTTIRPNEIDLLLPFAHAIVCALLVFWLLRRATPSVRGRLPGILLPTMIVTLPVAFVFSVLPQALSAFWFGAIDESLWTAWIDPRTVNTSAAGASVIVYTLTTLLIVRAICRRWHTGATQPDQPNTTAICWRCGYACDGLASCPECGQPNPGNDTRLFYTLWGARLASSQWRWAVSPLLAAVTVCVLLVPPIVGTIEVVAHRLLS